MADSMMARMQDRVEMIRTCLQENPGMSLRQVSRELGIPETSVRRYARDNGLVLLTNMGKSSPELEGRIRNLEVEIARWKARYNNALATIGNQERLIGAITSIPSKPAVVEIRPSVNEEHEVVPVIVASDWHIEETVEKAVTNGLNEYNLDIAEARARGFFSKASEMVGREAGHCKVDHVVLALLGDIINGVLREEDLQNNSVSPIDALMMARTLLYSGIKELASSTGARIHVVCCVGNHGRLTQKIFPSNQTHNSLEYLMYKTLERDFRDHPAVDFTVSEAYYHIMDILGLKVRFHHGHVFKFNGGIGGLSVPVLRKISQLNLIQKADLDVCGHFHSMQIFPNCVLNGSLVGVNGYTMSLGLPYEPPRQLFFLIDSRHGRTMACPITID